MRVVFTYISFEQFYWRTGPSSSLANDLEIMLWPLNETLDLSSKTMKSSNAIQLRARLNSKKVLSSNAALKLNLLKVLLSLKLNQKPRLARLKNFCTKLGKYAEWNADI